MALLQRLVASAAVLATLACCFPGPSAEPSAAPVPPAPTPAPSSSPTVPVGPEMRSLGQVSVLTFRDDALDECADFELTAVVPQGVDWQPPQKPLSELIARLGRNPNDQVSETQPCATRVPSGRAVFARCTSTKDTPREQGVIVRLVLSAKYYNLDRLEGSDGYMRDCMGLGGQWWELPEDSPEYRSANLARASKRLQGISRQLEGLQEKRR